MQIDSLEIFHLALPYSNPQETPWGTVAELQTVLVRMTSGDLVGWGEASPGSAPSTGAEWAGSAFLCLRDWLGPRVVGREVEDGAKLQERLAAVRGNRHAKAALDIAFWDLIARKKGQPLHTALGGAREAVEVGASFDRMESTEEFLAEIGKALEAGYGRIELKFRPGWDLQMVNAVRHVYPTQRFHVDAEGDMHLGLMETLCRLDDFTLAMVEQPLSPDDLVGHAMVQETIRTPVCLDESIATLQHAEMALELHAAKYINLKPGRVGGLTTAVAIDEACHAECVPCWVGGAPQTAIGARAGYALAARANCSYPADHAPLDRLLAVDVAPWPETFIDPEDKAMKVRLWTEPGLGISPNSELIEKHALAKVRL